MGVLRPLAVAAGALLLLTGCGERAEPTGVDVSPYPVTVGGTTLESEPQVVVALSAGAAQVLADAGVRARLVTATGRRLREMLARLHPDLIVAPSTTNPPPASGAAVYVMRDQTVHNLERALLDLGLLLNRSVAARALVQADRAATARLARALKGVPRTRVFVDTGFLTTISTRTLLSDLLRVAGGTNVAGPAPEPGLFSVAKLVRLDPQVYLATTDSDVTLAYLRSGKRTRKLSAVRDGRFHRIPSAYLEPAGRLAPRLMRLAELLHPTS